MVGLSSAIIVYLIIFNTYLAYSFYSFTVRSSLSCRILMISNNFTIHLNFS